MKVSLTYRFINFLLFHVVWLIAVVSAAYQMSWIGFLAFLAFLAIHLTVVPAKWAELTSVIVVMAIGWVLDGLLVWGRFLAFYAPWPWPASPLWMTLLWGAFALTFQTCFFWLKGRRLLAVLLGAMVGPFAYWAGIQLGAGAFPRGLLWGLIGVGVEWAIALPFLLILSDKIHRKWQGGR